MMRVAEPKENMGDCQKATIYCKEKNLDYECFQ